VVEIRVHVRAKDERHRVPRELPLRPVAHDPEEEHRGRDEGEKTHERSGIRGRGPGKDGVLAAHGREREHQGYEEDQGHHFFGAESEEHTAEPALRLLGFTRDLGSDPRIPPLDRAQRRPPAPAIAAAGAAALVSVPSTRARRMRASTAKQGRFPGKTTTGLRSSSWISGCSIASLETRWRRSRSGAVLTGGAPRYPLKSAEPRISPTISSASRSVIGATRTEMSRSTSTETPPNPKSTTGQNRGSRDMPTMVSIPPATIASTVTPSNRALGIVFARDALISSNARAASSSLARPSFTPPTSVLWTTSGDFTFIATGNPMALAADAASPRFAAARRSGVRMPYAWRISWRA